MDDAAPVRGVQRIGNLGAVTQHVGQGKGAFLDSIGERFPLDQLQDEVVQSRAGGPGLRSGGLWRWDLADIVQRADVRMIQGGDDLGLALEARAELLVERQPRGKDLDGYLPIQPRVFRLPDLSHPAGAQRRQDFIGTEPNSRLQIHDFEV
jgi:hypothetical protein